LLTLGIHEAVYAGPGAWRTPCHSTSPRSPSDKEQMYQSILPIASPDFHVP